MESVVENRLEDSTRIAVTPHAGILRHQERAQATQHLVEGVEGVEGGGGTVAASHKAGTALTDLTRAVDC